MSGSRGLASLGVNLSARTSAAAAQTDGVLPSPISLLDRPAKKDAEGLSTASVVAGGVLGLFAGVITKYNNGVDELNGIYEKAKAADFFADPVGEDATGEDGEKLSEHERQRRFDGRVASARSALVAALRAREGKLMAAVDTAAAGCASLLDTGSESIWQDALSVFGGSGDGGSPFAGLGVGATATVSEDSGLFGDVVGGLSDFGSGAVGLGEEAWDRGSTLAVYGWDTGVRRATHPVQTFWDTITLTAPLEDLSAAEGILGEDAELYRDGPYCGSDAACLTGASVPSGADALTTGHTIRFGDERTPRDYLVAHEVQHVYDIEDVGGAGFYGSYLVDYLAGRASGESHEEAYENIYWERRAYDVQDKYPDKKPRGILSVLYDKVFG